MKYDLKKYITVQTLIRNQWIQRKTTVTFKINSKTTAFSSIYPTLSASGFMFHKSLHVIDIDF